MGNLTGSSNYNAREVVEELALLRGDTCWYPESPYSQMSIDGTAKWAVGIQSATDIGTYSTISNAYGFDTIGFTNNGNETDRYAHYRSRMQAQGGACGILYQQRMYIDGCGGPSQYYGLAHGLQLRISASGLTVTRDLASATKY